LKFQLGKGALKYCYEAIFKSIENNAFQTRPYDNIEVYNVMGSMASESTIFRK